MHLHLPLGHFIFIFSPCIKILLLTLRLTLSILRKYIPKEVDLPPTPAVFEENRLSAEEQNRAPRRLFTHCLVPSKFGPQLQAAVCVAGSARHADELKQSDNQ